MYRSGQRSVVDWVASRLSDGELPWASVEP
jgi:hypothetical protein